MKKLVVLCLTLVMLASLGLNAFAARGSFVSSPSGNPAPLLIDWEVPDADCTATVVITSYADRDTLDDAKREEMENAYDAIANTLDLTELDADLAQLAEEKDIAPSNLAVSDLFDISYVGCEDHRDHDGYFSITFEAETLKNFVGLIYHNGEEWVLVDDAVVDGKQLTFTTKEFSPFAIVVDTNAQTGDNTMIYVWSAIAAASGVLLVVIGLKNKKKKA